MAIIDRNAIFFEGPLTQNAAGNVVAVNAMLLPGQMEPMPIRCSVTEAFDPAEVSALVIAMEQADSPEGTWTEVPASSVTVTNTAGEPGLALGARPYLRFLPQGCSKGFLRLSFTLTASGSVSKGRLFAALVREEDHPYAPAQMVR